MELYHTIAKSVVRDAMQLSRYSEQDKDLVIKQLGDLLQMNVRNLEMLKMNVTWAFMTERDMESPITFRQFRTGDSNCRVALKVLIYGLESGISIYECYDDRCNYLYIEGIDDTLNELCNCGDWDCETCSEQDGLANQLLVGVKE
jgi:hypothetical protein